MKPHLIILGAPGSGKGTQAARLVLKGFRHVSTGDLLRSEIDKGSVLGQRVASIISKGDLVDDATVLDLLKANCEVDRFSYIFDGFPRNLAQAKMLDEQLLQAKKNLAVYFKVDSAALVSRIVNRRTCRTCGEIYNLLTKAPRELNVCDKCGARDTLLKRKDDTEEVVSNRMKIFTDEVEPMLAFYKSKNSLIEIDASMQENEIFAILERVIN
jgi:adenylate kinase